MKIFDVEVLLDESDIILRPGMTVSCEIITAEFQDALYVDNAFISQEGKTYFIYLKKGGRRQIQIGPRNSRAVVVYGDIEAGERVVKPTSGGTI